LKGNQVAPAELEAHLLSHPFVADCAVVSIPHEASGEAPKAYVVKSKAMGANDGDEPVKQNIMDYVKRYKTKYKWVKDIEFIELIPKSLSGKTLRRILRDADRTERKKNSTGANI
jgi:acyl-coenzyme A synthetase/AMP-(fatty) acid ligase